MMSEISFSSTLDAATPLAKSRRISILPISHADLSSPTTARKQVQLLELDNVALSNELSERDEQITTLETQIEVLRSKLASSSTPTLSSSTSTDSINGERRYSAEVKAAKRLLHRLIAQIVAYDGADEADVNLDQSLVHDPERSVVRPSLTHLTTPNGKTSVARRFEGDLLDDIETLGSALKDFATRTTFAADEQLVALKSVTTSNEKLSTRVQELQAELEEARSASASNGDKDAAIEQLRNDLIAAQERESQSASELEATRSKLSATQTQLAETEAKLDQLTAEQELTISAAAKKSAAQIKALELQLEEQQESPACSCGNSASDEPSERSTQLEAQLEQIKAERDAAAQESQQRINLLESQLEARRTKASDLQSIYTELQEKKQRLHTIQMHTAHVRSLEKVVLMQERIVGLLDRQSETDVEGESWIAHAKELSASLAQLKSSAQTRQVEVKDRTDAAVATDAVEVAPADNGLIDELKEQIDELEARILRRNEQIGSLQRQLHNAENDLARTRTNHSLAEETVADLDAEKLEYLAQIKQLEERVSQLESAASTTAAASSGTEEAQEVQTSLETAQQRISELTTELEKLTEERDASHTKQQALESTVVELGSTVDQLSTSLSAARASESTSEAELSTLKSTLSKTEDRLASALGEVSTLQLSLAEQRESSSSSREHIESLQAQLSTLESANASLLADAATAAETRAFVSELTNKIALLENQAVVDGEKRTELESEVADLQSRRTELERLLAERDTAITARNEEYWTLKEELAELQEEAERSRADIAALNEVQAQLEAATKVKVQLEGRISAQESALLKLKSELTSARSTEELLNQQYSASQRRVQDLEAVVSQLETSSSNAAEVEELKAKVSSLESELDYLTSRISQLESELTSKADEIEEADSKILDALKESKKYATRYTKLSARYETLQKEAEASKQRLQAVEAELEKANAMKRKEVEGGGMTRSGSGGLAGRKRAKPDEAELAGEDEVRAVYAPSPSTGRTPSTFTPVRRSTKPLRQKPHTPVALGHGTPTTTEPVGGMVRSTSNPSQLIAERLQAAASPAKTSVAMLSDKTNLSSGSSRLSSKEGVKKATSLLPGDREEKRREERKVLGASAGTGAGAAGGGGAADFLARMKAQRAASAGGQRA